MIKFTVFGRPEPQGSTRAFVPRGWTRAVVTSDNPKLKPWRQQLSRCAIQALKENGGEMIAFPNAVRVCVCFYFEKPISVPRTRMMPVTRPDADKCARSIGDAFEGILYERDSQVTDWVIAKRFGSPERAEIEVSIVSDVRYNPQIAKELPLFAEVLS